MHQQVKQHLIILKSYTTMNWSKVYLEIIIIIVLDLILVNLQINDETNYKSHIL